MWLALTVHFLPSLHLVLLPQWTPLTHRPLQFGSGAVSSPTRVWGLKLCSSQHVHQNKQPVVSQSVFRQFSETHWILGVARLTDDVTLSAAASLLLAHRWRAVIGCVYSERAGGMFGTPSCNQTQLARAAEEKNVCVDVRGLLRDGFVLRRTERCFVT